jgi:hypothetical protein
MKQVVHLGSVKKIYLSQRKHTISFTNIIRIMMFREIVTVCSDSRIDCKHLVGIMQTVSRSSSDLCRALSFLPL